MTSVGREEMGASALRRRFSARIDSSNDFMSASIACSWHSREFDWVGSIKKRQTVVLFCWWLRINVSAEAVHSFRTPTDQQMGNSNTFTTTAVAAYLFWWTNPLWRLWARVDCVIVDISRLAYVCTEKTANSVSVRQKAELLEVYSPVRKRQLTGLSKYRGIKSRLKVAYLSLCAKESRTEVYTIDERLK